MAYAIINDCKQVVKFINEDDDIDKALAHTLPDALDTGEKQALSDEYKHGLDPAHPNKHFLKVDYSKRITIVYIKQGRTGEIVSEEHLAADTLDEMFEQIERKASDPKSKYLNRINAARFRRVLEDFTDKLIIDAESCLGYADDWDNNLMMSIDIKKPIKNK